VKKVCNHANIKVMLKLEDNKCIKRNFLLRARLNNKFEIELLALWVCDPFWHHYSHKSKQRNGSSQ